MSYAIGLDIGGTKVAAALMNEEHEILFRSEVPSNATDKEAMFSQVVKSVESVLEKSQIDLEEVSGFGVGVPGKVDRENGIAIFQNNLPWGNFPIAERLKAHFNMEKVIIDNDVYMATFAEWVNHGADPNATFVYYTISTGISAAIISNGKFVMGNGFAGEAGLLPVQTGANLNDFTTIEKVASGPSIVKAYNDDAMTTKDLLEGFKVGNEDVKEVVTNMIQALALGTYSISTLLDPHAIVFGGGVINHQPFLLDEIKEELKKYLIPEQNHTLDNLFLSKSKGDAGIIGAGMRVFIDF